MPTYVSSSAGGAFRSVANSAWLEIAPSTARQASNAGPAALCLFRAGVAFLVASFWA